ncbi:hypothetical protein U1Q18_048527 [Sarracenia purpurea var. burkii]
MDEVGMTYKFIQGFSPNYFTETIKSYQNDDDYRITFDYTTLNDHILVSNLNKIEYRIQESLESKSAKVNNDTDEILKIVTHGIKSTLSDWLRGLKVVIEAVVLSYCTQKKVNNVNYPNDSDTYSIYETDQGRLLISGFRSSNLHLIRVFYVGYPYPAYWLEFHNVKIIYENSQPINGIILGMFGTVDPNLPL